MFITDPREEGERFLNVVFLEKENATLKIKDFTDPTCNRRFLLTFFISYPYVLGLGQAFYGQRSRIQNG
jgi:hypothetical protein